MKPNLHRELLELQTRINELREYHDLEIKEISCELNGDRLHLEDELSELAGAIDNAVFIYDNNCELIDNSGAGYDYYKENKHA